MRIIQLTEYQGKESCQRQEGNTINPSEDFTGEIPWVCAFTLCHYDLWYNPLGLSLAFTSTVNAFGSKMTLTMSKVTQKDSSLVVICFCSFPHAFTNICFLLRP